MIAPARRQYLEIKAEYQDAILLYQVGDFFETFDEDARIAARELQIVLTGRSYGTDERIPLAGVPVHAVENYAAKLVARGYKVAICEQIGPVGKRLARREVTRVLDSRHRCLASDDSGDSRQLPGGVGTGTGRR